MAGRLRPRTAHLLIGALRSRLTCHVQVHTHDQPRWHQPGSSVAAWQARGRAVAGAAAPMAGNNQTDRVECPIDPSPPPPHPPLSPPTTPLFHSPPAAHTRTDTGLRFRRLRPGALLGGLAKGCTRLRICAYRATGGCVSPRNCRAANCRICASREGPGVGGPVRGGRAAYAVPTGCWAGDTSHAVVESRAICGWHRSCGGERRRICFRTSAIRYPGIGSSGPARRAEVTGGGWPETLRSAARPVGRGVDTLSN